MKAVEGIKNKAAVTVLLAAILGLVFLDHINDKSNNSKINKAIATIYDDRLVVEGYIFNYAQHLQYIIEAANTTPTEKDIIASHLAGIKELNILYAKTRLTEDESSSFIKFISLYNKLSQSINENNSGKTLYYAKAAKSLLPVLSDIQVQEAATEMDGIRKLFGATSISAQYEIGVLLIISLLIFALQFSGKSIGTSHFPKSPSLN